MTTNTPSLGYPATGITLSTKEKFHPGDFLGCVPVLTVRNSEHWLYRLSALGINPIAIRKETNTVSYLCTNKTGACKMMISSPIGDTGHRARAIQSHGAHFSELIIFCSDEKAADMAASLCEKLVTNSRPVNDFLFPITASYGVEIYPGTRYTFVAMDDEETVWRSWKAYALPNPYMDPDLDIKLDHIVQNLPADVYDQCRQLFETFGMETTFYGTDKVEFATRAFSPDKGIFDLMPFLLSTNQIRSRVRLMSAYKNTEHHLFSILHSM